MAGQAANVDLTTASGRITEGQNSGNEYITQLTSIRNDLVVDGGSTLGTMVAAQLKMTETETEYMVKAGLPKKASGSQMQAAQEVKKAAG